MVLVVAVTGAVGAAMEEEVWIERKFSLFPVFPLLLLQLLLLSKSCLRVPVRHLEMGSVDKKLSVQIPSLR